MKSTGVLAMSFLAAATTTMAAGFVQYPVQTTDSNNKYMTPSVTITAVAPKRGSRPLKVSLSAPNTAAFSSQHVGWDWKSIAASAFEKDQRAVILFDGVCNLCNGGVNFALDHDSKGECLKVPHWLAVHSFPRQIAQLLTWLASWFLVSSQFSFRLHAK